MQNNSALKEYRPGDRDERPWGSYIVTAAGKNGQGEEFCEKTITVNPGQILSLQSHKFRRERWTVLKGALTVVCGDKRLALAPGQSIDIPLGAIHCMANLEVTPCEVHERQEGICREDDIIRYVDSYGRGTERSAGSAQEAAVALYQGILRDIEKAAN